MTTPSPSCASPTAPLAILPAVTAPSASFGAVTEPSFRFGVSTAPRGDVDALHGAVLDAHAVDRLASHLVGARGHVQGAARPVDRGRLGAGGDGHGCHPRKGGHDADDLDALGGLTRHIPRCDRTGSPSLESACRAKLARPRAGEPLQVLRRQLDLEAAAARAGSSPSGSAARAALVAGVSLAIPSIMPSRRLTAVPRPVKVRSVHDDIREGSGPRALVGGRRAGVPRARGLGAPPRGLQGRAADDGDAALAIARSSEPDVVVLDIGLPGIDGVEVCRRLRTFSDAYVVMLTGRARRGRQDRRALGRRRRLHDEAVLEPRARGAHQGDAAAPAQRRRHGARGRAAARRARGRHRARARCGSTGQVVELTRIEFDLLDALSASPRVAFSRAQLLEARVGAGAGSGTTTWSTCTCRSCARSSARTRASPASSAPCAAWATASTPSRRERPGTSIRRHARGAHRGDRGGQGPGRQRLVRPERGGDRLGVRPGRRHLVQLRVARAAHEPDRDRDPHPRTR